MNELNRGDGPSIPPIILDSYSGYSSQDFKALCHSQMLSLSKSLKMDWGGVYLTEKSRAGETQLIPIIIYPPLQATREQSLEPLFTNRIKYLKSAEQNLPSILPQQIILPLLDKTEVIGLLVIVRSEQNWLADELTQLEAAAEVLAIARRIDYNCSQLRLEVSQLSNQRQNQQKYLDDLLHQIRNPVTALRTFAKLLIKKLLPLDENESTIKGIFRESERLVELLKESTGEKLPLSGKESFLFLPASSEKLPLEALSLATILEPVVNSGQLIAQEKELDLEVKLPSDLPQIKANAPALREVLSNLIDNALKYTPPSGKILITAHQTSNNWVKIFISDSGYGIPEDEQKHIFERHYRGRQAQSAIPGSGLGLAIVKDLLEMMNSKIELINPSAVISSESYLSGATFVIELPSVEGVN